MSYETPFLTARATATLEHTALRTWFACLGELLPAEPAADARSTDAAMPAPVVKNCPHPEHCRLGGCTSDCFPPLPAA